MAREVSLDIRWSDSSTGDNKIIVLAHSPCGFYYFVLVVRDDLYPFQRHAEREAEFGQIGRVGVDGLYLVRLR